MRRRLVSATAAAIALLILLAGPPLALTLTIGNPLPDWTTLTTGNIDAPTVLRLLACVAWLAWAQFSVGAVVEAAAAITGRALPSPITLGQGVARTLITALVTTSVLAPFLTARPSSALPAPTPAAAAGPVHASFAGPPLEPPQPVPTTTSSPAPPAATIAYLVGSDPKIGPTLWSIAEHTLNDPLRWREIWQLNQQHVMTDGRRFTSPDEIHNGWVLQLPPDAHPPTLPEGPGSAPPVVTHIDTVAAGDTLSAIAQREYGDPGDYRLIATANQGRAEPDGRVFTDPNRIWPGWRLTIPARPDTTPTPPGHTEPRTQQPTHPRSTPHAHPTPAGPAPSTTSTSPPATPTSSGSPSPSADASPSAASDSPARSTSTAATDSRHDDHSTSSPSENVSLLAAAGAGVLAALSLTVLARRRRRQLRHRRPHRTIPAPAPALRDTERHLRAAADDASTPAVGLLDDALRTLTATIGADPTGQLPDLIAAQLSADRVRLTLADPDADLPRPWTRADPDASTGGAGWQVRAEHHPPGTPRTGEQFAPYPTLATVATTDDHHAWLVDLEHVGTLAITGPAEHRRSLLRYLAAELTHNSWSDHLHVSLYGVGDELAALDPARIACHRDLSALLRILTAQTSALTAEASTAPDLLTRRLHPDRGDPAAPRVALLNLATPSDDDTATLSALLAELSALTEEVGRTGLVVVIATEQPPSNVRTHLHIAADGTLTASSPDGVPQPLHACCLSADEARDLTALLAVANDLTDRPAPASRGTAPWERYADGLGAPRTEHTQERRAPAAPLVVSADRDRDTLGEHGNGSAPPTSTSATLNADSVLDDPTDLPTTAAVLPRDDDHYLARAATTVDDLRELAPAIPTGTSEAIRHADPDLDQDLAVWRDSRATTPKLRLLGPPTLTGIGDPPAGRGALLTEIVAYLITRPHGATVEQIATDLWPHIPDAAAKTTPRQSVSMARQWLGADPHTGADRIPRALPDAAGAKLYRVSGVLADADLFRRLRLRGTTRGPDGIVDLRAALELVGGAPFAHRRPGGYSWLADTPLDHEYTAMILDTAHIVATHDLAEANPAAAAAAARVALRAAPDDDIPLLDLIAAHEALGNHAEAQSYLRRLLVGHDAEVEEDLPPRTYQLLLRHGWLPD